jgi:hypothetical protein
MHSRQRLPPVPDAPATRKARERQKKADAGLKRLELWAPAHHHKPIRDYAEKLREEDDEQEPTGRRCK